jgi:hypothetical protein
LILLAIKAVAGAGGFEPPYGGIKILQPCSAECRRSYPCRLIPEEMSCVSQARSPTYTGVGTICGADMVPT